MHVQHIDSFTIEELEEAYKHCIDNYAMLFSDSLAGHNLREDMLRRFKADHPEAKTLEQLCIVADLVNGIEARDALMMSYHEE